MAWVIIGGLITSTLLTRLVTPVMYKLIPPGVDSPLAAGQRDTRTAEGRPPADGLPAPAQT
jgi:hypothetical protein